MNEPLDKNKFNEQKREKINEERLDHAINLLKKRMSELKKLEEDTSKPLASAKLIENLHSFENEFMGTSVFSKFQVLYQQIGEKLQAYDDPINTLKAQIKIIRDSMQEILDISQITIKTAKTVGWILGSIVTICTLILLVKEIIN